MMRKTVAIFDLDGTLVDTLKDITNCMNKALADCGFEEHNADSYKYFIGTGVINLIKHSLPCEYKENKEVINKVRELYSKYYEIHYLEYSYPYEGINELLNELKKRKFILGIVSNKQHSFTKLMAEKLFGKDYFDEIIGQQDDLPKKPDPYGIHIIAEKFNVSLKNIIYAGDSGVDMETAKNANVTAVGVSWGLREKEELLQNGADFIINKPQELLKIIDNSQLRKRIVGRV